jgi:hypothetical protein
MASVLQGEQPGNKVRRWPPSRCTASGCVQVPANTLGPVPIDVPYPGFGRPSGAVASTVLIVILSGGLYRLFKRLDWL